MKEGGRSIRDLCKTYIHKHIRTAGMWWHAVEVHRCKLEDRGFVSFRPHCDRGVDSASNGNEYQEYFLEGKCGRCVRLTTLPPSFADCPEIWEPQPPATQWACNRPVMGLLWLYHLLVQNTNCIGKYSCRLLNPQELCVLSSVYLWFAWSSQ